MLPEAWAEVSRRLFFFFFSSVTSSAHCCFARSSPHNCITHPSHSHSSGSVLGTTLGHTALLATGFTLVHVLTVSFALPERGAAAAGVSLKGSDRRWLPRTVNKGTAQTELTCGFVVVAEVL